VQHTHICNAVCLLVSSKHNAIEVSRTHTTYVPNAFLLLSVLLDQQRDPWTDRRSATGYETTQKLYWCDLSLSAVQLLPLLVFSFSAALALTALLWNNILPMIQSIDVDVERCWTYRFKSVIGAIAADDWQSCLVAGCGWLNAFCVAPACVLCGYCVFLFPRFPCNEVT